MKLRSLIVPIFAVATYNVFDLLFAVAVGPFPVVLKVSMAVWAAVTVWFVWSQFFGKQQRIECQRDGLIGILSFVPEQERINYIKNAAVEQATRVLTAESELSNHEDRQQRYGDGYSKQRRVLEKRLRFTREDYRSLNHALHEIMEQLGHTDLASYIDQAPIHVRNQG